MPKSRRYLRRLHRSRLTMVEKALERLDLDDGAHPEQGRAACED